MLGLIDKIPGASKYKDQATGAVTGVINNNPRTFAIAAVAGGAMLLIAILFGLSLPLSVAIPLLITAVVVVGGKIVMNKYLKAAHGDKAWFKTLDRVLTIALPILVVGGAIGAGSIYGMMMALPAVATVWTFFQLPMALGLPMLAIAVGIRQANKELDNKIEQARLEGKDIKYLNASRNALHTAQAILTPAAYVGLLGWMLVGGPTTIYFYAGLIMVPFIVYPISYSMTTLKEVSDNITNPPSSSGRTSSGNRIRARSTDAALRAEREEDAERGGKAEIR